MRAIETTPGSPIRHTEKRDIVPGIANISAELYNTRVDTTECCVYCAYDYYYSCASSIYTTTATVVVTMTWYLVYT